MKKFTDMNLSVRVDALLGKELHQCAAREERLLSDVIRRALRRYVGKSKEEEEDHGAEFGEKVIEDLATVCPAECPHCETPEAYGCTEDQCLCDKCKSDLEVQPEELGVEDEPV